MGHMPLSLIDRLEARRLASSLEDVAGRLGNASTAEDFVAAIADNHSTWRKMHSAARRYGWRLPKRFFDFCLAATACCGISDHDVEAIILINRTVANTILTASGLSC